MSPQGVVGFLELLHQVLLWSSQSKPRWRSLCWKKATECQAFPGLEKGVFQTAEVCERIFCASVFASAGVVACLAFSGP